MSEYITRQTPSLRTWPAARQITQIVTPPVPVSFVKLAASTYIAAGGTTDTTRQLSVPAGKAAGDFEAGKITDDTNPLASFDPGSAKFSEWEVCLESVSALIANGDEIEFRLTNGGAELTAYTRTPKWTIGSAVADALGWMTDGQSNRPLPHHLDKGVYVGY